MANENRSIAFPTIIYGVYRFPVERIWAIAMSTIGTFLLHSSAIDRVILVVYSAAHYEVYGEQLAKMREGCG
ncbi:MAG: hypothetical protein BA871_02980 [Desulfuromonadales bacterium C00003096]|nr:MAG: hypothetical protein BA871_02980 [Desulfuromonadales bacterium C00003096]